MSLLEFIKEGDEFDKTNMDAREIKTNDLEEFIEVQSSMKNNDVFSELKAGGFNNKDNSFNIFIGGNNYCGGEEISFWLNRRAAEINSFIEKSKSYPDVKEYKKMLMRLYPIDFTSKKVVITDEQLYKYIINNSTMAGGLIVQLNYLIDAIISIEENIIKKITEHCEKTKYISIPEEYIREKIVTKLINKVQIEGFSKKMIKYGINQDLIYNPNILHENINGVIDYINAFNISKKYDLLKHVDIMKETRSLIGECIFNLSDEPNIEEYNIILHTLFKKEIELSNYIKKLEEYHGYIIDQINIIINRMVEQVKI